MSQKRLPDTEFLVMKAVWQCPELPVSTHDIMKHLPNDRGWKPQTVLTLLKRLADKGFLESERKGKERFYTPIISEADYLAIETDNFMKRYKGNSISSLVRTFFTSNDVSAEELEELRHLLEE
ncbi:BlaI/MecI/CopY family transcriptional regulator [Streptococcus macacae]|uniref:Transcriptional regulator, BlaI/MecI/CopY family n=1 Tax=Streptococcus macacae NCTC 11558 TaxID=764298 RepID=G5JV06_9STRE|nr:BlaI/MecI/CopY family transcriptional regulator [Streptococcus macacae]EHJ52181.1 transcriptional regulator, BlaI/MecI/CopY family [Streptococcus macacae NCTC 11558]SUN79304.1 penicillinase repressor [Streptococcus macacae NCTC 11558]